MTTAFLMGGPAFSGPTITGLVTGSVTGPVTGSAA